MTKTLLVGENISLTIASRKYRWLEKYRKIHEVEFRFAIRRCAGRTTWW